MVTLEKLLAGGNHLDIYLNHNCNLRCSHCFVGEQLDSMVDMPWDMFTSVIDKADSIGLSKVTLLGGEPTTYPYISKACKYILSKSIDTVRIVTNGTKPYCHFLDDVSNKSSILTIFSIDGASKDSHDLIRGDGVFDQLYDSIERAKSSEINIAGIATLSKQNYDEISDIIHLSDRKNFEYLNVHKASHTGFASKQNMLSPKEWLKIRSLVIETSKNVKIPIKFDRKYVDKSRYDEINDYQKECFVKSGRDGNIMIYPDGRVYRCSLFMDQKGTHDYEWRESSIVKNQSKIKTEGEICNSCNTGCPGVSDKPNQNESKQFVSLCMYRKEIIKDGEVSVHA